MSVLTRQTLITPRTGRIVDTLQTLARRSITIAHRIRIHIPIAIARLTQLHSAHQPIRIAKIPIGAQLATLAEIPDRTFQTNNILAHLQARSILHARTPLAIVLGTHQRIAIKALGTLVARIASRVVLANTTARLRIAVVRMLVAVARLARHERSTTRRTVPIARHARLTVLPQIAHRTRALFDPVRRLAGRSAIRRLQLHVVQHRLAARRKRAANLDRRQIRQNRHERPRRLARLPRVLVALVQPERILAELLIGHLVALRENRQRYPHAGTLQNHIAGHRQACLIDQLQPELQQPIVRRTLIAEEPIRRREVQLLVGTLRGNTNVLAVLVVLDIVRPIVVLIDDRPAFVLLVEVRRRRKLRVANGALAFRCVAVAEARRATELVVHVQIEEARLAFATPPPLDVVLALADARLGVARRRVVVRAARVAVARQAALRPECVMVGVAAVALIAGNARFALAAALAVALKAARTWTSETS